jgi:hypothetical protein
MPDFVPRWTIVVHKVGRTGQKSYSCLPAGKSFRNRNRKIKGLIDVDAQFRPLPDPD